MRSHLNKISNYISIFQLSNEKVPNYLEEIRKNPKQIRKQKTHCRKKYNSLVSFLCNSIP